MKRILAIIICNISLLCTSFGQWQEVNNGLTGGRIGGLFFDPVSSQVFAGTMYCGIFVSDNYGQGWKTTNTGLPDMIYNVDSFVSNGTNLFAACSSPDGIFLSTDNGKTWISKKKGLPEYTDIHCLVFSGTKLFAGTVDGVYVSVDNGDNWTSANNGLSGMDQYINTIAVKGGSVFAGGLGGMFVSNDDGGNWTPVTTGLIGPALLVKTLIVIRDEIYAGTDKGVWKRPLSDLFNLDVSANALNIEAPNLSKVSFNIYANTSWTVSSSETWLSPSSPAGYGNELIDLAASGNSVNQSGTASVTVSNKVLPDKTILVTKEANGIINYVQETENNTVGVYPNPAKEYLNINTGAFSGKPGYSLNILDMSGKTVFETKVTKNEYEIHVGSWSAKGIYIVQIYNDSKKIIATKKIILQ